MVPGVTVELKNSELLREYVSNVEEWARVRGDFSEGDGKERFLWLIGNGLLLLFFYVPSDSSSTLNQLRAIKSEKEISLIAHACKLSR
jgi:Xaa-Pro aminopeptidase